MLSRIFWAGIAGLALLAGMALQDGGRIFSWADDHTDISTKMEQSIAAGVDRAVERSIDKMEVVGSDGEEIDVPPETKRALAGAVGRLIKAETAEAMLRARDGSKEEQQAAEARSEQARAEVDRLKAEIKRHDQAAVIESDAITAEVKRQIRDDVREEIRDAARN